MQLNSSSSSRSLSTSPFLSAMQHGFSLVEIAIVMLIAALLLGGGLSIFTAQQEMRQIQETLTLMDSAKDSLIGYAASHQATDGRPFLPCPDKMVVAGAGTPNDGLEDRTAAGACVNLEGNLPWVTLGIASADIWANHFRYRVTAAFSNSATGMLLTSTGDIAINDAAGIAVATAIPAVIVSHGRNGYGARNTSGIANLAPPAANISETENTDGDTTFISNPPVPIGGVGGEFDDHVIWVSPNILFNRMLAAGRLP